MAEVETDLMLRVANLERRFRIAFVVAIMSLALCALVLGALGGRAIAEPATNTASQVHATLRVRELNIVDKNNITRIKIGSPLPNATIDGKQNKTRGGLPDDTMSGILLFDAEGVERSGYATVDQGYSNVLLTLDDKNKQHAMFIAEPTGATTLRLFNGDTKDRFDMAIDQAGPSISMVQRGKEIYHYPPK